jgi:hypothetical protein
MKPKSVWKRLLLTRYLPTLKVYPAIDEVQIIRVYFTNKAIAKIRIDGSAEIVVSKEYDPYKIEPCEDEWRLVNGKTVINKTPKS